MWRAGDRRPARAGAWAFLLGSYLQLLEALNKHPLSLREVFKK